MIFFGSESGRGPQLADERLDDHELEVLDFLDPKAIKALRTLKRVVGLIRDELISDAERRIRMIEY